MSEPIIKIRNLSKLYRIGSKEDGCKTFREAIIDGIKAPFKNIKTFGNLTKFDNYSGDSNEEDVIWALKDVSLDVYEGEVVGIIGRNGAGKSTLLKILSRITDPTSGHIEIQGRISSLLEVGTGFHPELTGRENVFLNGAILGMRKEEIKRKFDEIVEFAEIEKFLDTPVKRYSSGMYVRLAFAVAAHLEPEILVVDEVLAVGDAAFQKKCLGKMGEVAKGGRTVLFVSHNMEAIQKLCSKVIWINEGEKHLYGVSNFVVERYLEHSIQDSMAQLKKRFSKSLQSSAAYYDDIKLLNTEKKESCTFSCSSPMAIEARVRVKRNFIAVQCGVDILTMTGILILNINSKILGYSRLKLNDGSIVRWNIQELRLAPGRYFINIRMKDYNEREFIDFVENVAMFEVLPVDVYNSGHLISKNQGITYMPILLEIL